jgi:transglutaminase-like putative cysteine protease
VKSVTKTFLLLLLLISTGLLAQDEAVARPEMELSPKAINELPALTVWEKQLTIAPDEKSAVILYSSGYKRDTWTDSSFSAVKRIKVLGEAGQRFATFQVKIRAYEELTNVQGVTILADGGRRNLDPDDYQIEANQSDLWSPEIIYTFTLPAVEPGAIIEYSYTIETQLGDGLRFNVWNIQDTIHTFASSYTLDMPENFMPYSWDMENTLSSSSPAIYKDREREYAVFQFGELYAIDREEYMPPLAYVQAHLVVDYQWNRSATSVPRNYWYQIGRSQALRLTSFLKAKGDLDSLVSTLTENEIELEIKVDKIRDWIDENISNLSELESNKLIDGEEIIHEKNATAEQMLMNGYGNPLEISMLTIGMLRSAGIKADLVLTVNREKSLFRMNFLDFKQLNVALIAMELENGTVALLDPTARSGKIRGVPWYVQGSLAVLCRERRSQVIRIPVDLSEENSVAYYIDIDDQGSKGLGGRLRAELTGQAQIAFNKLLKEIKPEEKADYIASNLYIGNSRLQIISIAVKYEQKQITGFDAAFRLGEEEKKSKAKLDILPPRLKGFLELPAELAEINRMYPLYLPFSFQIICEFRVEKEALEKINLPDSYKAENIVGTIRSFGEKNESIFSWKWQVNLQKLFYKPVESKQFQDFLQSLQTAKSFRNKVL